MKVSIVPMSEEHISPCAEILSTTPLWVESYGVTYESALRDFRVGLADDRQTLRVALHEGAVIGLTYYSERGAFYFGSYLRLLAVHADYRNHGIGAQLMADVEAHVQHVTPNLFLLATAHNTGAHRFYMRHGYSHVGTLPDFVVDGTTEYIFWKRLA